MPIPSDQLRRDQRQRVVCRPCDEERLAKPPHACGEARGARPGDGPAEARDEQRSGERRADRQAECKRRQRDTGMDRREVLAELQEQRHHQQRPDHPGEEHDDHGEPSGVGAVLEDARLDQRIAPAPALAASPSGEQPERRCAGGDHQIRPRRPTGLAPLDQRVDQQAHPERGQAGADQVQVRAAGSPRLGHHTRGADRGDQPSGRLMKKISRQPLPNASAAISAPPRIGPRTADRPITGPNTVNARDSSSGANTSRMIPSP